MTIECVTLETSHCFPGNPLAAQHRLRYRCIIERQDWQVPKWRDMEYDQYDNPAATYLVWRDRAGAARGLSRLYPTDRPFMLQEAFPHLVTYREMPCGPQTLEGSRFCVDHTLEVPLRKRVARELVQAYLEYGLQQGITQIIGVMYPAYWRGLFARNGWEPEWIGEPVETDEGMTVRAAMLPLSEATLASVRRHTGIRGPVLTYGRERADVQAA